MQSTSHEITISDRPGDKATLEQVAKAISEGYGQHSSKPPRDIPQKSRSARKAAKANARRIRKLRGK